jgi:cholinesterase
VDLYTYSYPKDPIIKGGIAESGTSTMCGLVGVSSYYNWPKLAAKVGCSDAKTELSCLRSKNVTELLAGSRQIGATFPPPFVPTVDGKIVFDDYYERGDRGEFAKVVRIKPTSEHTTR